MHVTYSLKESITQPYGICVHSSPVILNSGEKFIQLRNGTECVACYAQSAVKNYLKKAFRLFCAALFKEKVIQKRVGP